jgi:hypothetical protein
VGYEVEAPAPPAGPRKRFRLSGFSALSLLVSNALVIVFAVVDKLSALDVLWIYWFQSVIIGVFHFVEIKSLKAFSTEGFRKDGQPVPPTKGTRDATAVFFLFHYGFFHFLYATFLGTFSALGGQRLSGPGRGPLFYSTAVFFFRYLVDFIRSRSAVPEGIPNLGRLMIAPYARIVPMHLTIMLGGALSAAGRGFSGPANLILLVAFMGFKTVVDLITETVALGSGRKARS